MNLRIPLSIVCASGLVGCSTSSSNSPSATSYALEVPCSDLPDNVYKDPGALPAEKGAILKCAPYKVFSKAELEAVARSGEAESSPDAGNGTPGYSGRPFTSGATVYRVLYRTERGDPNNTPGYSSALVFIPDTPRAAQSPIVVASHGSRGQAAKCAPSKDDPAGAYVQGDFVRQVYPLVGMGYAVIAPDLAGYANYGATGNPPSTYGSVADVGKSTLDGARALKKLIGKSLLDKVVLTGHSQGGDTALGALALQSSYASELTIAAVTVYSPLWISLRANGAFLLVPDSYPMTTSPIPKVIAWYLYTHGELIDGPGHGVDVFAQAQQLGVKNFVDNDCWAASYPDLNAMGNSANELLDPGFVSDISVAAGVTGNCSGATDQPRCQKWLDRFRADWPHITNAAAQVPLLSLYGGKDTTMTPDLAACVFDRYKADQLNYKVCFDPAGSHGSILSVRADYVADWIAAKTLGGADPGACPNDEKALTDDAGAPVPCNKLLPPD
jgi:pimeloyl-ACP methyl ester carboxylesterase